MDCRPFSMLLRNEKGRGTKKPSPLFLDLPPKSGGFFDAQKKYHPGW
jgi:hypothetical protein